MDSVLTKSEATKYIVKISKFVKLVCKVRKQVKISLKFFSSKIPVQISRGGGPGQFGKTSNFEFFFWKASLSAGLEFRLIAIAPTLLQPSMVTTGSI